jgi:hypothetical protein
MVLDDAKITTPYRISMTYPLVEQNTNLGLTILECRQAFSAASTYIIDCRNLVCTSSEHQDCTSFIHNFTHIFKTNIRQNG